MKKLKWREREHPKYKKDPFLYPKTQYLSNKGHSIISPQESEIGGILYMWEIWNGDDSKYFDTLEEAKQFAEDMKVEYNNFEEEFKNINEKKNNT